MVPTRSAWGCQGWGIVEAIGEKGLVCNMPLLGALSSGVPGVFLIYLRLFQIIPEAVNVPLVAYKQIICRPFQQCRTVSDKLGLLQTITDYSDKH